MPGIVVGVLAFVAALWMRNDASHPSGDDIMGAHAFMSFASWPLALLTEPIPYRIKESTSSTVLWWSLDFAQILLNCALLSMTLVGIVAEIRGRCRRAE